jgi:hypothetical protein
MMIPKVPAYLAVGHRVPFMASHVQAALAEVGGAEIS